MNNNFDYLIKQLNLLIGFIETANIDIFNLIKKHDRLNIGLTIEELYDNDSTNFINHITNSSLLLGFTHFEDYLTKIIKEILLKEPIKNKIKFTFNEKEKLGDNYIEKLAEKQSNILTFKDKIKLIKSDGLINDDDYNEIILINKLRNCLMHNNGIVKNINNDKYKDDEKIIFNNSDLHTFGLLARKISKKLNEKYPDNGT